MAEATVDAKVVLLGETGVGKTSLAMRFGQDIFSQRTVPTVGASFLTKVIQDGDCKVKLRIWDTAGQERFRSLAPMYYRGAVAAILVFDLTKASTFEKMKEWVKELQINLTEDIILVIVGNKCDMDSYRDVATKDAQEYADTIGALAYVETSAKTGNGVESAFSQIAKKLNEQRLTSPPRNDYNYGSGGPLFLANEEREQAQINGQSGGCC